jgi:Recombinase
LKTAAIYAGVSSDKQREENTIASQTAALVAFAHEQRFAVPPEWAIPTCKRRGRWERSTVWGMLRNPAYKGQACFGKTTMAPRQRITRPIRLRVASRLVTVRAMSGRERIGSRLPCRRSSAMTPSRLRKNDSRLTRPTRRGGPSRLASCRVS